MGFDDNVRRAADEVAGRAKEMWGDLTDNERLQAEGRAQHMSDAARVADHELDPGRADRITDDAYERRGDTAHPDDSGLRDELRDDMGQDPARAVPADDPAQGNLRDALRDDMGQGPNEHTPFADTDPDADRRDRL